MFEIKSNPQLDKSSFVFSEYGEYPYFTRTIYNNGILGNVNYLDEEHKIKGGCLAVGMISMQFFYMEKDFYAGQFTKRAIPKTFYMNPSRAKFFISLLNRYGEQFKNVLVRDFEESFTSSKISLPTRNGAIDFDFMETFIAELEAQRIAELEAYLTAAGLKDCTLTAQEEEALRMFEAVEWGEYSITEVFDIKNTKSILSSDIVANSGNIPYLCASADNNSVSSYISYKEQMLDKGNCVFIGGKTFVVSYQEFDFFSNDSHNLALYVIDKTKKDKISQLFLVTCVKKSLGHKYTWGDSISKQKINTDNITLPQNFSKTFMQTFISAIQKLVIRDVAAYSDRKMTAARQAAAQ